MKKGAEKKEKKKQEKKGETKKGVKKVEKGKRRGKKKGETKREKNSEKKRWEKGEGRKGKKRRRCLGCAFTCGSLGSWSLFGHPQPPPEESTGVLWLSTGTHPCGPPPRQDGGGTRAPALRTLDDYVLRFRGDEEYGLLSSHPSSTCSWLRSGRPRDHVHILPLSDLIHLFIRELLTRAHHHVA